MRTWDKVTRGTVVAVVAALILSGCGPTMGDLPLPGSGVGGDTVTLRVQFDEALNLAVGAPVKVNGVNSGKVQSVEARDFKALAVLKVKSDALVRTTATARLRYNTPLGELFVDMDNPASGEVARDGVELNPKQASTAPTVEDALASTSLLINGGGLNQLQTVTEELNTAVGGREDSIRRLLERSNTFLREANATTGDIDRALRALVVLSKELAANRSTIKAALTDIRPAAAVLRQNTPGLTALLAAVVDFSDVANDVVGKTRKDILQLVRQVSPVLQEFLNNGKTLGTSLQALVEVSETLDGVIPGDYINLRLKLVLDQFTPPDILGPGGGGSTGGSGNGGLLGGGGAGPGGSNPLGGLLGGLLGNGRSASTSAPPTLSGLLGGSR